MIRFKRLVLTCFLLFTCFLIIWHVGTIPESTSEILQRIEKKMSESIADNIEVLLPPKEVTGKPKKKKRNKPNIVTDDFTQNKLYQESIQCLFDNQRHLAANLHSKYAHQFSSDFRQFPKQVSPILEPECNSDLDLIVMITTRPGNFMERTAIRYSWGRPETSTNQLLIKKSFKYKAIFTLGRDNNPIIEDIVSKENTKYRDILRLDYSDTYENLAKKTILSLKWISEACQPKFVLKTDDDCYVNLYELSTWLSGLSPHINYIGKKNELMPVIRDPTHRNYVPYEVYGDEFYKVYCSGGGYILRGTVLGNITRTARKIAEIINEDAYLGMIAHALDITPFDDERFLPFIFGDVTLRKRHMCDWTDKFLMHGASPRRQLLMHWQKLAMTRYTVLCDL